MIEPANEIEPITAESTDVNETSGVGVLPALYTLSSSPAATSAAAPPPAPLKIATICGIAVIFTRCAETIPIAAPTISAEPSTHQLTIPWLSVATTAIAMPTALMRLPRRAVFGELRKRRPMMKQTAVTRYATSTQLAAEVSTV